MAMRKKGIVESRESICPTCEKSFVQAVGRGKGRKHCSAACRENHKKNSLAERRKIALGLRCFVASCLNSPRDSTSAFCEMHYGRMRRNGNLKPREVKGRYVNSAGYIRVLAKGHPLADSHGHVYEHRKVLYDSGISAVQCFWCSAHLGWDTLVVDHLNENKADNRLENLVAACTPCNRARGAFLDMIQRVDNTKLDLLFDTFRQFKRRANG